MQLEFSLAKQTQMKWLLNDFLGNPPRQRKPSIWSLLFHSLGLSIPSLLPHLLYFLSFFIHFVFGLFLFRLIVPSCPGLYSLFVVEIHFWKKKLWGKIHMLNCNYKEVFLFFVVSAHLFTPQVGGKMSISLQSCTFCEFGSPLVHVQVYPLKSVQTPRHG